MGKSNKQASEADPKDGVWDIAASFAENSTLLVSLQKADASSKRIRTLTIDAVAQQRKSADAVGSAVKRTAVLIRHPAG